MSTFESNWLKNGISLFRRFGLVSATQFSGKHQLDTYADLARRLNNELAPAQIEMLLCREAINNGKNQQFQIHNFCRHWWNNVPKRWKYDKDPIPFEVAKAVAGWSRGSTNSENNPFAAVIARLQSRKYISEGWCPIGIDDQVLDSLFRGVEFSNSDYSIIANEDWIA
jgi:hypothetical protein